MRYAILLAAALLLAGCTEKSTHTVKRADRGKRPPSTKGYTAQEFRWIKRLAKWERSYGHSRDEADAAYYDVLDSQGTVADLRRALLPLRRCGRSIRAHVGEPPSEDLRAAYQLLLDACVQDRRFAVANARAFTSSKDQGPAQVQAFQQGEKLFRRAHRRLERRLLANRPLPVAGGMAKKSRIEPRLSGVASKLALKQVEVRCWSHRDWQKTVHEYEVYAGQKADIAGFANGITRANLNSHACSNLARFAYRHWRPASRNEIAEAADAVELLAHETEHLLNPEAAEDETECHGVQDVRRVGRALGANRPYAARLSVFYWRELYRFNPGSYRTPDCRNGGLYDINPSSNVWP